MGCMNDNNLHGHHSICNNVCGGHWCKGSEDVLKSFIFLQIFALIKKHKTTIFLIMYIYVSYNALYRINSVKQSLLYILAFTKNKQQPIF